MLGIPKEVVFKDLDEVLAKAMGETGDFDTEKYRFVLCQGLFRTLEIWLLSKDILNVDEKFNSFAGVKISISEYTNYFYLEYTTHQNNVITFAATETIKKYFQAA